MVFLRKHLLTAFLLLIFSASCTVQDWFTPGGEYATPDSPPSPPLAAQVQATSEAEETTPSEPAAEGKAPEDLANQIEAELIHSPEIPPISNIKPERPYVEPGMYASFLGHPNLTGELKLTGPNDMILMGNFSTGRGSITIPVDAFQGLYIAAVNGSEGALAFGQVYVVNEPSLWVHIDRRNTASHEVVEVRISAYGLPEYSLAGIGLGRADWKSVLLEIISHELPNLEIQNAGDLGLGNLQDEASDRIDKPVSILIPNENGVLVPNLTKLSSLQEMTAQTLLLPGFLAEQIQDNLIHTGVHSQESVRTILRLAELQLQEGNHEAAASILGEMSAAVEVDFLVQGKLSLLGDNHFLALSGINYKQDVPVILGSGGYERIEDMYGSGETGKNFIEKMADAAICGKVISHQSEIEPGQNEEIAIQVTNLAGEVVDGAYIEAQAAVLGILDPTRGEISDGEFTTEYRANPEASGQEHLIFEVIWEGSAGPVKPERVESNLEIDGKYWLHGGLSAEPTAFPAAGLFQGLHFTMEAYSCQSGKGVSYEGSVTGGLGLSSYDEDPAGIPSEQSFKLPLSINIPIEGEPFQLPVPFHSLTGRFHQGLDIIIFSSMGIPLFFAEATPLEMDTVCPRPDL
jgi:hypothetical protein